MKPLAPETNFLGIGVSATQIYGATVVRLVNTDSAYPGTVQVLENDAENNYWGPVIGSITVPAGEVVYIQKKTEEWLSGDSFVNYTQVAYSHMMSYASYGSSSGGGGSGIPTSDLYMDLDANDSSSYGGSGTTWSDLTSNNNDWTMVNGMNFVSSSPKHMNFDGTNDWATRTFSVSSSSETTWIIWCRPRDAMQNNWAALLGFRYGGDTQILGFKSGDKYQYHWKPSVHPNHKYNFDTGLIISNFPRWEMISLRVNSTSARFDQKFGSTSNSITNTDTHDPFYQNNASGYIGRDPENAVRIYAGDIARILVWTRRLTDSEVDSVYDTTKGTFGY